MIKQVNFLEFDTDRILDNAVFMAIEAYRKCKDGFGIIAPDRLELAIKGLQETLDEINKAYDNNKYPDESCLEEKNII